MYYTVGAAELEGLKGEVAKAKEEAKANKAAADKAAADLEAKKAEGEKHKSRVSEVEV